MIWVIALCWAVALVCLCLPCEYDPAIRLREWMDGMDREPPDE